MKVNKALTIVLLSVAATIAIVLYNFIVYY